MTRHIIGIIAVLLAGLVTFFTILSARNIMPSLLNITLGAILTAGGVLLGILCYLYPIGNAQRPGRVIMIVYALALLLDIIMGVISVILPSPPSPSLVYCSNLSQEHQSISTVPVKHGIGVTRADDNEFIGISDGSFAFDTGTADEPRADTEQKCQAAARFAADQIEGTDGARSYWEDALQRDTNDAEELIYRENQNVIDSGSRYVTIIIATMLTGDDRGKVAVGRDNLQGIYVAQKEYNSGLVADHMLPKGTKVRILIANAGSQPQYVEQVTQQIIQLAQSDKTFIGVIGWNFSAYAQNEMQVMHQTRIPMISPSASKDALKQGVSNFFRIAPTNKKQTKIAAEYIRTHFKRVVIFADYNDPYSGDLATDLHAELGQEYIVHTETYRVGEPSSLEGNLAPLLLQYDPNLIYFSGYPNDLITLLKQFPPYGPDASLKVMGGDALYEVNVGYPANAYRQLIFTAFAFPDEWAYLCKQKYLFACSTPPFFQEYQQDFDPRLEHQGMYGWSRADSNAILSYDAVLALLNGCTNALIGKEITFMPTPGQVLDGLNNVTSFQGASGLIFLHDDDGTSLTVNKVVTLLSVDNQGHTQLEDEWGQFTPDYNRVL